MSRLIDADLLMENLGFMDTEEEREENVGQIITWEDVDRMPTAFDVKNVIEQLKEESEQSFVGFKSYAEEHGIDNDYEDWFYRELIRAIEIVKRGGRDEE